MNAAFQQEAGQGDFGRWERFGQMIHVVACLNSKVFFLDNSKQFSFRMIGLVFIALVWVQFNCH